MSVSRYLIALALVSGVLSCRRQENSNTGTPPVPAPVVAPTAPAPVPMESFFKAALDGDLATVKQALAVPGVANQADPDGRTALMLAAFNGHTEIAALLLDAGARIDTRDQTGRTALMYAASGENEVTVALLIKRRAGVNLADSEEHWTPLMFAAAEGQADVVRRLLDAGADPTAADIDGEDSVLFARSRGYPAVADLIAQAKARAESGRK